MTSVKRVAILGVILAAIVLGGGWRPTAAQAPRNEDVLPALLTEVRGLRAAMEQLASANAQSQLLVGRLQLQETRMNGMIRRLDTVRDNLAAAEREWQAAPTEETWDRIAEIQQRLARGIEAEGAGEE